MKKAVFFAVTICFLLISFDLYVMHVVLPRAFGI